MNAGGVGNSERAKRGTRVLVDRAFEASSHFPGVAMTENGGRRRREAALTPGREKLVAELHAAGRPQHSDLQFLAGDLNWALCQRHRISDGSTSGP
jgi:hypothetical protein